MNFAFLDKALGIVSAAHFVIIFQEKCFVYILFIEQMSLSDCLYFIRYWVISVLQLFVSQVVTS